MSEEVNSSIRILSKKKSKVKKLEGSSYSKSIDITRENLNLRKEYLKERIENPYWIPNLNKDIFLLKGIYRNQYEEKRNKLYSFLPKGNNKSHINSFDKTEDNSIYTTNLLKRTGLYVTEQSMNNSRIIKADSEENQVPLAIRKSKSKQWDSMVCSPIKKTNPFNKRNGELGFSKLESIKGYLVKTKQLCQMKLSMKLKEERIERMKESYKNELNTLKDSIGSMIKSKDQFEEDFNKKYKDYFKYIKMEKDREEGIYQELKNHRNELENETKKMEIRINRLKDKNSQLREYRKFIQNVSHKKSSLVTMHKKAKGQDNIIRKFSIISSDKINSFEFYLKNITKISDIYKNPSELIDDIKLIEQQIVLLLSFLDDSTQKTKIAMIETVTKEKQQQSDKDTCETDIRIKEDLLTSLKEKNERLKDKKREFLIKYHHNTLHSPQNRSPLMQLYDKINLIYKRCHELTYIHNKYDGPDHLEMMRLIERSFDFIYSRYIEYFKEIPENVATVEKELEAERKRLQGKELRELVRQKAVLLKNKLEEKFTKIPLQQTRNTYEVKNLALPKVLDKKPLIGDQFEPILQDLLYYQTQDFI